MVSVFHLAALVHMAYGTNESANVSQDRPTPTLPLDLAGLPWQDPPHGASLASA